MIYISRLSSATTDLRIIIFLLADFESYLAANARVFDKYKDKEAWMRSAVMNTAKAGFFSSDRTIEDYNREIWHLR